ncbi:MAG: hypothetical protein PHS96_00895 [Anaerolineales bacterium]|nr:hypothetical protein [Anaerolineales bacterium]
MIDRVFFTSGAVPPGGSTAQGYSPRIAGLVLAVHVAYLGGGAATTDFSLTAEDNPAQEPVVELLDQASNALLYPRRPVQDRAGAGLTYDGAHPVAAPYAVAGRLVATLTGANPGQSVAVTAWVQR